MKSRSPLPLACRAGGRTARTGFTLVEMAYSAAILLVLGSAIVTAMRALRDTALSNDVQTKLQESGEKALMQIVSDLRRSGQVTVGLNAFPYLFEDGNAVGDFAGHWHQPAQENELLGQPGFGVNREIVFLQPQDADGDDVPDLDGNAALVWGATQFSYVLVTGPDGVNRLERRTNGASPRSVCSSVERIVFDDVSTDVTLPINATRVRLFLRQPDARGAVQRWQSEATVRLRNGI